MTRNQLAYRQAGARRDLVALLAPYTVPSAAPVRTPIVADPNVWPAYSSARSSNWVEGDW